MPAPDYKTPMTAEQRKIAEMFARSSENALANEIVELRKEIAALRAELAPVPSLIVTGKQALDEFKRLTGMTP